MTRTVEFRRLVTHGEYENTTIGYTTVIEDGETAVAALARAEAFVAAELERRVGTPGALSDAKQRLWRLENEAALLESRIAKQKKLYERAMALLASHGLAIDEENIFDAMPF